MKQIKDVVVVGGGTAGFMAALALKIKIPQLNVTVIRSPEIGIIGVGEGSVPAFAHFIHGFLGIPLQEFMRATRPGIKTGTCFLWGPRPRFFFPFGLHMTLRANALPKAIGYYAEHGDFEAASPLSARMKANRTFVIKPDGSLSVGPEYAYHIENDRLATYLEAKTRSVGINIIDGTINHVSQDDHGITGLGLSDSRKLAADLYVDCSGFRSLLLAGTFKEPKVDYSPTLACDRAVVGGWPRPPGEPMLAYTLSETMDAGWCWRIDHPDRTNRGYVYCSACITDAQAEQELRKKNPRIGPTRIVKFSSGRCVRSWVKNVVAIGNASGFVEPLEATSLAVVATRCQLLIDQLLDGDCVVSPPMPRLFNEATAELWDSIRDFLALHYRFNTRFSTPFWLDRQNNTDLATAVGAIEYYQHIGPSPFLIGAYVSKTALFGSSGHLAILTGLRVPARHAYRPTAAELAAWDVWCRGNAVKAQSLATVEQAVSILADGRPA